MATGVIGENAPALRSGRPRALRLIDEPVVAALLRPLCYMIAAFVFAYPLTTMHVARWVSAGALIGAVLGRIVAATRLRLYVIVLSSLAAALGVWLLRSLALASPSLAATFGPAGLLGLGNAFGFAALACTLAAAQRAAALRQRLFIVGEVAFVGIAFSQALAAHRGGQINRPFELADSIIAAGGDPEVALLWIGAVTAGLSVVILIGERSPLRALLTFAFVAVLLALIPGIARLNIPMPSPQDRLMGGKSDKDGDPAKPGRSQSGDGSNNEQLEFRDNYDAPGRLIPLAVVLLHDEYSPPNGLYYFRQTAFSHYNGRRLVVANDPGIDADIATGFPYQATTFGSVPPSGPERVTLDTTVAILADHNRAFALEAPVKMEPVQNPDPGRFKRVYRVTSAALIAEFPELLGLGVGDPGWTAEQRDIYVEAPSDPRYAELAERIVQEIPEDLRDDPVARAVMVSLWLSREGVYSLKSKHAHAEDPTGDFLFGDKTGYCVHFSHAAVYLMRALGIPARVGAGYVYEEAARQGGSAILLAGANSHAWPEAYVAGVGWVVIDVSPERALDPAVQPPDADLQRLLGEMARGLTPLPQGQERPFEPITRAMIDFPRQLGRALVFGSALLLVLLYTVKLWRRVAPLVLPGAAARLHYRAELDRLSEVALRRDFGESREAFARRIAAVVPSFSRLTRLNIAAVYGRERGKTARDRELARALGRERAANIPWKRRIIGMFHPFAWLYSR